MRNRLLTAASALGVVLGTGCSKELDLRAASSIKSVVSYTLDGRPMSGTAKVVLKPAGTNGSAGQDSLFVHAYALTQLGASEYIHLAFVKSAGQSDVAYRLATIYIDVANAGSYYFDSPHTATLTQTAPARWSGTFAGTRVNSQGTAISQLTSGVFTQIPQ